MKNIVIKLENNLLAKYTIDKLKKALNLVEPLTVSAGFEKCIMTIKIEKAAIGAACYCQKEFKNKTGAKEFVITSASNADIIIAEVIKEYNKLDYKEFNIGGGFNNNKIKVKVYNDKVNFNGEDMSFDKFITMRNILTLSIGGFNIGGENTIQLTSNNTRTKVYIDRNELQPITDCILGKL